MSTTITGFSNQFAISNWTLEPNTGSIDTTSEPGNIILYNGNSSVSDNTKALITSTLTGTLTFSWNIYNVDSNYQLLYDQFYFVKNGIQTAFASNDLRDEEHGAYIASGTFTQSIAVGDVFGFNANTYDGLDGYFKNTISNFSFTYEGGPVDPVVPEEPFCFNEGTKILCLNKNLEEEYIPIEQLRKNDLVKSYKHGYRKIDLIGKNIMVNDPTPLNEYECMHIMKKTKENGLIDDLIVTGGHSILVDDLGEYKEENDRLLDGVQMIDDKYLLLAVLSNDFEKLENTDLYTYYHFILENNGNDDDRFGVWANGVLTETPNKCQFLHHQFMQL